MPKTNGCHVGNVFTLLLPVLWAGGACAPVSSDGQPLDLDTSSGTDISDADSVDSGDAIGVEKTI